MCDQGRALSVVDSDKRRRLLELFLQRRGLNAPRTTPVIERADAASYEPSFAQQRLWFLHQLEADDGLYNMTGAWCLRGPLNVDWLIRSIHEIVRRHDSLRTRFVTAHGLPIAVVERELELPIPVTDVGDVSQPEQNEHIRAMISSEAQQPFDLERGPLIRPVLLRAGNRTHVLIITMHHIISDGLSFRAFRKELQSLYASYVTGRQVSLPELPVQYGDYARWQRESLEGRRMQAQLGYWKKQLSGFHPLELPLDFERPQVQTHAGARVRGGLSASVVDALGKISRESHCTLFITLLAGFGVLLHRLAGQEDVCIGIPIASRSPAETENLIGLFINTLVMRADFGGNPTFEELLQRVRQVCLEAYDHQDLPFEGLVRELAPHRDTSRNPLFQVFFNMSSPDDESFGLHDLTVSRVGHDDTRSKFDLTVYTAARNGGIRFDVVYSCDLFEHARMTHVLAQYEHLLTQIAQQPCRRIRELSLVTPQAERILPNPRSVLRTRWEEAAHGRVHKHVRMSPCKQAIVDAAGSWTYAQLAEAMRAVANHLRTQGIRRRDVVAVCGGRSASLIVGVLGVLEAGGTFVILDSAYPPERLRDCVLAAKPRAWLQVDPSGDMADESDGPANTIPCRLHMPANAWMDADSSALPDDIGSPASGPDAPMYIAFTSGTTVGCPKGVVGTHGPLSHFLQWHCATFHLTASDRFAMLSGLSHDPLLRDIFTPLWLGATLCIPGREEMQSPRCLVEWMQREQISVVHATPALIEAMTVDHREPGKVNEISSLRYVFFGGDRTTARHVMGVKRLAPNATCVNFYGTTETPQAMSFHIVGADAGGVHGPGSVSTKPDIPLGCGIEGAQLLLLNGAGQLAGVGELAEICVRSPHLCKGYLNDADAGAARFVPNPFTGDPSDRIYRTGDLGRYRPDGSVEFHGRSDRQVKIRGFRVEPAEVETALGRHPAVQQVAVAAVDDKHLGRTLVAWIVYKDSISTLSLRAYLRRSLPGYMIPAHFIGVDALPLTPNGKIDFGRLPSVIGPRHVTRCPDPPCTTTEQEVAAIWREVTGVEHIGRHDNFFDLGGHSLLVIKAVSLLERRLGLCVPFREFFNQTLAEFAACCERRLQERPAHE
jgi:amino acid adenylation domain-containing protein